MLWALEDPDTTIQLPEQNYLWDIAPTSSTAFLKERFYGAKYAYSIPEVQKWDGVVYEGWILILVDHERRVISWAEHFCSICS